MYHLVTRLLAALRRPTPLPGRGDDGPPGRAGTSVRGPVMAVRAVPRRLCGEDVALVRPYLVAWERRERVRRRTLVVVTHAVELGAWAGRGAGVVA
jgi:hypothetical protein